jgi:hypothetical protein
MRRHDKVKINGANGQTGGKIAAVILSLAFHIPDLDTWANDTWVHT